MLCGFSARTQRVSRAGRPLAVAAVSIALLCAILSRGEGASPQDDSVEVVQARKFVVVDEKGRERITLGTDADGCKVKCFDANREVVAALSVVRGNACLALTSANKAHVILVMMPDGTSGIAISGENGVNRVNLMVSKDGEAAIRFMDGKAQARTMVGVLPSGEGLVGLSAPPSDNSVFLRQLPDGECELGLTRSGGKFRGFMRMETEGTTSLKIMGKDGKDVFKAP